MDCGNWIFPSHLDRFEIDGSAVMSAIGFNFAYSSLVALAVIGVLSLLRRVIQFPAVWVILIGLGAFAVLFSAIAMCQRSSQLSQERGE
jgi:uncharacterized membrane protein YvlD (DUF360 family)